MDVLDIRYRIISTSRSASSWSLIIFSAMISSLILAFSKKSVKTKNASSLLQQLLEYLKSEYHLECYLIALYLRLSVL